MLFIKLTKILKNLFINFKIESKINTYVNKMTSNTKKQKVLKKLFNILEMFKTS